MGKIGETLLTILTNRAPVEGNSEMWLGSRTCVCLCTKQYSLLAGSTVAVRPKYSAARHGAKVYGASSLFLSNSYGAGKHRVVVRGDRPGSLRTFE